MLLAGGGKDAGREWQRMKARYDGWIWLWRDAGSIIIIIICSAGHRKFGTGKLHGWDRKKNREGKATEYEGRRVWLVRM